MLRFSDELSYIPGLVRGLQQPVLAGGLELREFTSIDCTALLNHGKTLVPSTVVSQTDNKNEEWLLNNLFDLLISLFHSQQIISSRKTFIRERLKTNSSRTEFEFFFPLSVTPEACRLCFTWLAKLVQLHSSAAQETDINHKTVESDLSELTEKLSTYSAPSYNRFAIARAAFELDYPLFPLHIDLYYLGQGTHCRMMASSFTEDTPAIAANLAKNKFYTGELLRTIGLPSPKQFIVNDHEQAQLAADKLGYPVVVKAADLDEGKGVYPNLSNADEVSKAFEATRELTNRTLMEEHIEGQTHRLTVFQNQVIRIVQ
ncbi:MAG: acetate--CoA ligase family protein, partial [Pseudomonadales bacterium]|nr:acetate--CoA ligase family protein [Pseudomonadales bacterium]